MTHVEREQVRAAEICCADCKKNGDLGCSNPFGCHLMQDLSEIIETNTGTDGEYDCEAIAVSVVRLSQKYDNSVNPILDADSKPVVDNRVKCSRCGDPIKVGICENCDTNAFLNLTLPRGVTFAPTSASSPPVTDKDREEILSTLKKLRETTTIGYYDEVFALNEDESISEIARIRADAVKAEREKCEDLVCAYWNGDRDELRRRILSDDK